MTRASRPRSLFAIFLLPLLPACTPFPQNARAPVFNPDAGYRFSRLHETKTNSDDVFVVLTFSGGGTRAAAFSYGVLDELRHTTITIDGHARPLLDEVDVISSVSGGSFTAAYYALHHDRLFCDFDRRFLKRNVQSHLTGSVFFNPLNWPALWSPEFSRIDLAAEYYDDILFDNATFGDLACKSRRPYLILNATDMSLCSRFEFTQSQFDLLHSDLDDFHVARAVAASSAFPVLLSPLAVRNYHEPNGYVEPKWVAKLLAHPDDPAIRYDRARRVRSYLSPDRDYVHLLDGGLSDNIGLRGPWESVIARDTLDSASDTSETSRGLDLSAMLANGQIHTLIFIIVNARNGDANTSLDRSPHTPGILPVLSTVAFGPFGNYSTETVDHFKQDMTTFTQQAEITAAAGRPVTYLQAEINFDAIPDQLTRDRCRSLGTNFGLPSSDVNLLKCAAAQAMRHSPAFQKITTHLADYHTTTRPTAAPSSAPATTNHN